jgi:hypothetical protein
MTAPAGFAATDRIASEKRDAPSPDGLGQGGSIVLFALFVCLAVAVVVQTLAAIVIIADRSLSTEQDGRARMQEKDDALAQLRQRLLADWQAQPWLPLLVDSEVQGSASDLAESQGWAMIVQAEHQPAVSPIVVSALVERGRDGLDLPFAGLVAGSVGCGAGRTAPWLEMQGGDHGYSGGPTDQQASERSAGFLVDVPAQPLLGPAATVDGLDHEWRLDDGWRGFLETAAETAADHASEESSSGATGSPGVGIGPGVTVLVTDPGITAELPSGWGASTDQPELLVLLGGGRLDARGRGDVYGVVVVDGGDLLLEGTKISGALFATGSVDVGESGTVVFVPTILRWATDRSLLRTRLVPGTRQESIG